MTLYAPHVLLVERVPIVSHTVPYKAIRSRRDYIPVALETDVKVVLRYEIKKVALNYLTYAGQHTD